MQEQRHLRHVVVCGEPVEGCLHWDLWLSSCPANLEAEPTNKDDVAFWLWTSGSTGRPKAGSYICIKTGCTAVKSMPPAFWGIDSNDIMFSSSKLFHAYGLGNSLMFPFHVGAMTKLFPGRPQAKVILDLVQTRRPSLFFSVPTLYAAMLQETDRASYDLSSVRVAVSAAEPLPAEIFRRWKERFGFEILDGIGSTEVLHIYLSASPGQVRPGEHGTGCARIRIADRRFRRKTNASWNHRRFAG